VNPKQTVLYSADVFQAAPAASKTQERPFESVWPSGASGKIGKGKGFVCLVFPLILTEKL
jgi:hypothetical protein